jgi:hypothetical protein
LTDEAKSLGARFVVFYNANPLEGTEKIFAAVSDDLRQWRRVGATPAIENLARDRKRSVISGDPQVVRMGDEWVMFYFGAFWNPGAFDTFAASRDLVPHASSYPVVSSQRPPNWIATLPLGPLSSSPRTSAAPMNR